MTGGGAPLGAGGLALITDMSGHIIEVVNDELGLLGPSPSVAELADLVDAGSLAKLDDFLNTTVTRGAAFTCELRAQSYDRGAPLTCSAGRVGERLVVLIAVDGADAAHLTGEMLGINNEQVNRYRYHLKDVEKAGLSIAELDEFMRLNNELANLQRELSKTNRQLAATNEQKNQFLGMAAHELRSPLGVISTYAQFLDEEIEFDDEHRNMMSTIRRTIVTMRLLVDELLDVATIESGRLELDPAQVDLAKVVSEVIERHAPMATRKSIHLDLVAPDDPVIATVDRDKIVQVLDNLVTNAIKFSHPDGVVTVRAAGTEEPESLAELTVTDDGIGIPEEMVATLFTPFSVSRAGTGGERGTGLGLAIVKRIVQGHGGSVQIDSQIDRGTTITLLLPR